MRQADEHLQGPGATELPLPADVDPWAIASDPNLDRAAKLRRLHQLEEDVRLVEVALEEGMSGHTKLPPLTEVLAALDSVSNHEPDGAASSSQAKI